jgi:hypothetical protein
MKQIIGFDKYSITENGDVWSHCHKKFMKTELDDNGYKTVRLTLPNLYKRYKVHRLVALTYLQNKLNKKCVNHINGIKTDNRLCNLEWMTHSENCLHAFKIGLHKHSDEQKQSVIKARSKAVLNTHNGLLYESLTIASKENDIHHSTLSLYLRNVKPNKTNLIYI